MPKPSSKAPARPKLARREPRRGRYQSRTGSLPERIFRDAFVHGARFERGDLMPRKVVDLDYGSDS
jgi:hypothetical protein